MESVHVFKTDKKTIDTQKVTFSIWKNRANAEFVRDFTETLRYIWYTSNQDLASFMTGPFL